jgi:FdhD protein
VQHSQKFEITRVKGHGAQIETDTIATEEPLEIRIGFKDSASREEKSVSITMRTPGNDHELAVGFLYTEGILTSPADIIEIWHRSPPVPGSDLRNVIRVDLVDEAIVDLERLERHFYTTSSCGVCGKASLDALRVQSSHTSAISDSKFKIDLSNILTLANKLEDQQKVFGETGGLHASGLFDSTGEITITREDVGRHNAMDKLVGRLFLDTKLPASEHGILVSGRTSFELVQKVAMAGVPMLVAVGAPSSLAIDVAREFGITLIGFLRDGRFNIYSADHRIGT